MSAFGLNFRDIMAASGVLPVEAEGAPPWRALGLEGAGVISEVADGVDGLAPGMPVAVIGRGCMRSRLATRADCVLPLPDGISLREAAALPTAFLTAYFSLVVQGRLQPGERVLIHAATGGVGLAATQIARHIGADVIASAGSARKREHLRELGVEHIVDSRSLSFADDVMAATDGEGADVVLNSLSGSFLDKGLQVLAPYGRFLEIGKRDIYQDNPLALRTMAANKSFHVIDLAGLARDRPAALRALFAELQPLLASRALRPPPIETHPLSRASEAFARMAQARHIGKIVIEADRESLDVALDPDRPVRFRRDASYLVTGGTSGFGLALGAWLARQGAGHVVLSSRRGPAAPGAAEAKQRVEAAGARASILSADATDRVALGAALARVEESGMPLAGVFHAAMVLDDALLVDLDADRLLDVLAPKALGALHLHDLTRCMPIEHFVGFSSIAAGIGARGQANYVAANLFLEELARCRRGLGLPALTVSWGAIGDTGVVARDDKLAALLARSGIEPLPVADALERLGFLLRRDPHVVGVARVDLGRMGAAATGLARWRRTGHLFEPRASRSGLLAVLAETAPEQRKPILMDFIAAQLGEVLRVEASKIDPALPFNDLGVDSLSSLELKTRLEASTGLALSVGKFLARPTVEGLAEAVLELLARDEDAGEDDAERPIAAE